jgi:exodeoxyribonuclease III
MKIRLLSWNVNGIRAIYRKGFLDWLKKENPDILGLQETKAREEQLVKKLINVEGYKSFFTSAENKKGYSGTAVYTKIEPRGFREGLGEKRFDEEGRVQILEFEEFTFFNIYYPNGRMNEERLKYKMEFYDLFYDYVDKEKKKGKKLVICGDLNTAHKEKDLARPKANEDKSGFLPIERKWVDKFLNNGFIDTFREFNEEGDNYSYWDMKTRARDRNVGWRIDYFFISENLRKNLKDAFILREVVGSDHCSVGIELEF